MNFNSRICRRAFLGEEGGEQWIRVRVFVSNSDSKVFTVGCGLERLLRWVLSHEKFCYHPLLLLKICPLLWATLLSMHCSCMLMEERSIHYFATVSNYCHVCNWWFQFRENVTHYKITGQERIPVETTISIRGKQWCAGVLGPFLALQQFLPVLVTLANLWHLILPYFEALLALFPF